MDAAPQLWHYPDMADLVPPPKIPTWHLYGETTAFPDILHVESIPTRAAKNDWKIAPHRHLYLHQMFLLASGDITMTLDGARHQIAPPAVVNIPRGTVHSFVFSAGTEGYVVTLPADDFPEAFGTVAETSAPLAEVFILPATPDLTHRFLGLAATHAANRPFRRIRLRAEVVGLLAHVLDENAQQIPARRATADPRMEAFEGLIRANLTGARTANDHARDLALSPRHLSRLCKLQTGLSAQAFVEAQKIREACRLLVYTRMSVQQVAYHLGFDDPSYFTRVFQRNMQLSPSGYRQRFEG